MSPGPAASRPEAGAQRGEAERSRSGRPPLRPFGLVLHHDGSWSHEGQPIRNRRLREHFDRSVRYLPDERKFVVTLRHFRGQVEVEEAAFFVRAVEPARGLVRLSDGTEEPLDASTLHPSPIDGAWLCRVKRDLAADGLLARFTHAAHAELAACIEAEGAHPRLRLAGRLLRVPDALLEGLVPADAAGA